ncbi:LacI family DNA-binding transcriptional regulator [Stackebrandtia nassauensis]|uniref:Transcriptional regulator, LacI family n=1 Tax=Stackebrandtia nassauensis (strain DSM 44728 / CIP 108903 / NRRL B-16338 / NBRC 102104 / LLR-40K-21) TaxID=446470 RepID=D3Q7C3_STANL|nr:LacI family DNA-binding transcriptional regulator [Stackebrandtia nassauensis]ADD42394.1 transcriptional regulator, LacI family [Stackebrandtia nassauensis DSM 44728]
MKPTLQTVADVVGVSRSTVSNAYSRPDQLSPELRQKILDAARELGYAGPNATARSLRRGRAGAIGVLFTTTLSYAFIDPYAVRFLRGLSEAAERHDTGLLLIPLSHDDDETAAAKVREAVVDGFCVYCVPDWHHSQTVMKSIGRPAVTTAFRPDAYDFSVGIDDRTASRQAAAHLLRLGHRRLAVLAAYDDVDGARLGPIPAPDIDKIEDFEMRQRLRGIRDAVVDADLDWSTVTVVNTVTNSRAAGHAAAAHVLDTSPRPTAVLGCTDLVALGTIDALRDRGLRPGLDVSVTGFDDIPEAQTVGLSTVRQPAIDKGVIAGELLLDPPDDPGDRHVLLPTEFIVRTTTGPAERS